MVNQKKEVFYTHATEELVQARALLADFSFVRTHERLLNVNRIRASEELQTEEDSGVAKLYSDSRNVSLVGSQFADERPCVSVRMSPDGVTFASASLNTVVKIWDASSASLQMTLTGNSF